MSKENHPFLSDDFLDEVVNEINKLYGGPTNEQSGTPPAKDPE